VSVSARAAVERRWVARVPATVGELLTAMGEGAEASTCALAEGRVFVGRRRARGLEEPVRAGEELLLHPARARAVLPTPFVLLHERGLLAVHKPAGIPTIADARGGEHSLAAEASRAIGVEESALHATSRLDRDVSGVVIFALNQDAAHALAEARSAGRYERRYVALARGVLPDAGRWSWPIARAKDARYRRVVEAPVPKDDAIDADTRFRVVRRAPRGANGESLLLAVAPITGRTHQIRVHAAFAGAPLLGDAPYGGERRLVSARGSVRKLERIALHCARVRVTLGALGAGAQHGTTIDLRAPIPAELLDLARVLDLDPGTGEALDEATTCEL
jgi:23S rRNA-/tRNA-specific pseudouridylate synthase